MGLKVDDESDGGQTAAPSSGRRKMDLRFPSGCPSLLQLGRDEDEIVVNDGTVPAISVERFTRRSDPRSYRGEPTLRPDRAFRRSTPSGRCVSAVVTHPPAAHVFRIFVPLDCAAMYMQVR